MQFFQYFEEYCVADYERYSKSLLVDKTLMYRDMMIQNSLNGWTKPFISETCC